MKMWQQYFLVCLGATSIAAVKIPLQPLESKHTITEILPNVNEQIESLPIYYETEDNNGAHSMEAIRDVPTPATYLLPPSPDKQNEYFVKPTEPGEQTEWYPIATPAKQEEIIHQEHSDEEKTNLRSGKSLHRGQVITVPSRNLLPPRENAQHDFIVMSLSPDLELPSEEIDHTLNQHVNIELPVLRPPLEKPYTANFRVNPSLVPFIMPPKNVQAFKNPTRLYPKKYVNEFKPIPIPVAQYKEESEDLPTVKPQSQDAIVYHSDYLTPSKEKKNYVYEETQKKHKNRQEIAKPEAAQGEEIRPAEQDTSESIHRYPGNHVRPTQSRKESVKHKPVNKSKGERTEFRMHGMKGPNSYQFGYDTGKGKNRQFRYEERDNDGHVRGHYGYVDKFGKLRVVNYDADPELGFRAEAPVVKD
ncbi:uncharacterized protein LOC112052902 [Bicyclus anynana]|uniref:Uncharacterized protein LOC112052902 n=1 Tax=Bicyclus anynana TaxID=110368 RepID=A0A6J1NLU9_BICAN|nr:uncharacterized protein LOC112052902 [Bicyclus anynana]